ncbi:MAG: hemerythrin domain-containing protein [Myxococcales bacterium]|nr:MAG: hemerythrin domain-containing protein [Myxococcales bacterium]
MPTPPNLLNDDGSASMATMFMMSHHGLRRDLLRFERALGREGRLDEAQVEALRAEWQSYRATLHGHHQVEDTGMFPRMREVSPALAACIDDLAEQHRQIDPLLTRGDSAFAELPSPGPALAVVRELRALLEPHLAQEEQHIVPVIRSAGAFPGPGTDAEADLYAQGFAWSSHGIAPDILQKVYALLPEVLTARLPAARAAFDERCRRAWGTARAGAARTPIPEADSYS